MKLIDGGSICEVCGCVDGATWSAEDFRGERLRGHIRILPNRIAAAHYVRLRWWGIVTMERYMR
ncbi:hypothetical protein [Paenibacillus alvei]|uniref:hypothetical protein n=1 Tax=Paenibacillus alvei TaxID=44250 RepID=UPI00227F2F74|nr:hypothetical protein [Paenibacillus alvei]MCY7487716.1 hypothetical protein [Paenibacillus alvei]